MFKHLLAAGAFLLFSIESHMVGLTDVLPLHHGAFMNKIIHTNLQPLGHFSCFFP